jgi:hypothetical protein
MFVIDEIEFASEVMRSYDGNGFQLHDFTSSMVG